MTRIALVASLLALLGAAATARAAFDGASTRCPNLIGPAYRFAVGTAPSAPIYTGTRYYLAATGLTCTAAVQLVRKLVQTPWRGRVDAFKVLPGFGCGARGRNLKNRNMIAGECFSRPDAGTLKSLSWGPLPSRA